MGPGRNYIRPPPPPIFGQKAFLRGEGVYQHRAFPLHKHLHTIAFGFADAQVDLALAKIEKGSSLPSSEKSV